MPGFIKPQLATLKAKALSGAQWIHEVKFDGYRIQLHANRGSRKAFTRNGLNWTKRFSALPGLECELLQLSLTISLSGSFR
jgi:bifunctional non-homologous end joining protein LigD